MAKRTLQKFRQRKPKAKVDVRSELQRRQGETWAVATRLIVVQWGLIGLTVIDIALHAFNFLTR